jgi:hypothetical protein
MVDRLSIEAMRLIGVRETAERLAGPSWNNQVILDVFGRQFPLTDNGP